LIRSLPTSCVPWMLALPSRRGLATGASSSDHRRLGSTNAYGSRRRKLLLTVCSNPSKTTRDANEPKRSQDIARATDRTCRCTRRKSARRGRRESVVYRAQGLPDRRSSRCTRYLAAHQAEDASTRRCSQHSCRPPFRSDRASGDQGQTRICARSSSNPRRSANRAAALTADLDDPEKFASS